MRKGLARERAGGEGIGGVSDGARGSKGRERDGGSKRVREEGVRERAADEVRR